MEDAGEDGAMEEGVQIALELIEAIKNKQGVNGIHLMPVAWESIIPRIVEESGLLPPDFQPVKEEAAQAS
jgi:methylenetetrahydrofolate reductase (NADPH)